MTMMSAFRLPDWGTQPRFEEVPRPDPGPGGVLVKMAASGVCGSDVHLTHAPAEMFPFRPPFTLGHENAGYVAGLGPGVAGFAEGDAVLASSATSCGHCAQCVAGADNYCQDQVNMSTRMMSPRVRGLGFDGGLAEYLVVPVRDLVPLSGLDPRQAAPLADAGATSYQAVTRALPVLVPGSHCLVIGCGGLGSFAVQYLRLLTASEVIVTDIDPERLSYATGLGAHHVLQASGETAGTETAGDQTAGETAAAVLDLTGGGGVAAVLDFVGSADSLALADTVVRPLGKVVVPGIAMGTRPFGWGASAPGCEYSLSLGFTMSDLRQVLALGQSGRLTIDTDVFAFADAPLAYERLAGGKVRGRVVIEI
jgi:propanol-preferring alcohol dehydrogenase